MNCSEWNNIAIDHIDGFLKGQIQREADEHIEKCPICKERVKHFLNLTHALTSSPRNPLPLILKKSRSQETFLEELTRFDIRKIQESWQRAPWYFRALSEGFGILGLVLLAVVIIPMARNTYEKRVEKQLDALQLEQLAYDYKKAKESDEHSNTPLQRAGSAGTEAFVGGTEGETEAEDTEGSDETDAATPHAAKGQIWRFILRTDSPKEVRPKIMQTLTDLNVPNDTPHLGGIEAPGGIQFDLMISSEVTGELKVRLDKLAEKISVPANLPAGTDVLTWYKLKSKTPIPAGKTRVIIWISQI